MASSARARRASSALRFQHDQIGFRAGQARLGAGKPGRRLVAVGENLIQSLLRGEIRGRQRTYAVELGLGARAFGARAFDLRLGLRHHGLLGVGLSLMRAMVASWVSAFWWEASTARA